MKNKLKNHIQTWRSGTVPKGYVDTPIGPLPKGWSYARLDEIAEELTETAGQKSYETLSISAGVGFVNQAEKFGKELSGKQYEKYIVLHKGDFSYNKGNSNRYPQGCIYRLNDRDVAAVPNVFESFRIVKGCPDYYEQLFISGFLNHQLYRLINHGVRDDGLLNLTGKDFYSCLLPVPPENEQKKMVEILKGCDKTIELYQDKALQYQNLKKACMDLLFPKAGSKIPQLRFPGFTVAWKQRKLGDISDIKTGPFGTQLNATEYVPSGTPVINVKNIGAGRIMNEELDYVSEQTARRLSEHKIIVNDIVFGRKGAIGRHAIIGSLQDGWLQGSDCIRVRLDENVEPSYINGYLQSGTVYDYLSVHAYGSTMLTLTTDMISSIPVSLPEKEEQKAIGKYLNELDNLITLHQRISNEYQSLKAAMAQLLLMGIVRVEV